MGEVRMIKGRRIFSMAAAVVTLGLVAAGCGSEEGSEESTDAADQAQVAAAEAEQAAEEAKQETLRLQAELADKQQEAPAQAPAPAAEPKPEALTVPELVGERLDIAEDDLQDMGLKFEEIGGGVFGVVDTTAWEVCETDPAGGSGVSEGDRVELVVDRPGDC